MASSTIKTPCVTCEKSAGIAICSGCQKQFCVKHFLEHRTDLSAQMDRVGEQHDLIRRDFNKDPVEHPLQARIDQWEQETIVKIQVAAEAARADLREILDRRRNEMKTSIDRLTTELQTSQESNDYTETDLDRWRNKLNQLEQLLHSPDQLDLVFDSSPTAAVYPIKISETLSIRFPFGSTDVRERFAKFYGPVLLLDDGLQARNIGDDPSRICGMEQYSTGVHRIHFRIDDRTNSCPFVGIISAIEALNLRQRTLPSVNGWSDFDYPIINGKHHGLTNGNRTVQSGDLITLILDCNQREILLEHDRTRQFVRQNIDLQICPFPWKIFVALLSRNESIRILHQ